MNGPSSFFSSSATLLILPEKAMWSHVPNTRGGRHCWMFVFTLHMYTLIFSTKFEPFEQKMVWIMFYWLQMFCFHKSKQHGCIPLTCTVGVYEMNPASWHTLNFLFVLSHNSSIHISRHKYQTSAKSQNTSVDNVFLILTIVVMVKLKQCKIIHLVLHS